LPVFFFFEYIRQKKLCVIIDNHKYIMTAQIKQSSTGHSIINYQYISLLIEDLTYVVYQTNLFGVTYLTPLLKWIIMVVQHTAPADWPD